MATLHLTADDHNSGRELLVNGACAFFPDLGGFGCDDVAADVTVTIPLVANAGGWTGSTTVGAGSLSVIAEATATGVTVTLSVDKSAGECAYNKTLYTLSESAPGTLAF